MLYRFTVFTHFYPPIIIIIKAKGVSSTASSTSVTSVHARAVTSIDSTVTLIFLPPILIKRYFHAHVSHGFGFFPVKVFKFVHDNFSDIFPLPIAFIVTDLHTPGK